MVEDEEVKEEEEGKEKQETMTTLASLELDDDALIQGKQENKPERGKGFIIM